MTQEFLAKAKENLVVAEWSYENGHSLQLIERIMPPFKRR